MATQYHPLPKGSPSASADAEKLPNAEPPTPGQDWYSPAPPSTEFEPDPAEVIMISSNEEEEVKTEPADEDETLLFQPSMAHAVDQSPSA